MMKIVDATIPFTTTDHSMDFENGDYTSEIKSMYRMAVNEIKTAVIDE